MTELPITSLLTEEDLRDFIVSGESAAEKLGCLKFPCHTQSVEQLVKLVTEISVTVCGENKCNGLVRTRTESRKAMPSFETK